MSKTAIASKRSPASSYIHECVYVYAYLLSVYDLLEGEGEGGEEGGEDLDLE